MYYSMKTSLRLAPGKYTIYVLSIVLQYYYSTTTGLLAHSAGQWA